MESRTPSSLALPDLILQPGEVQALDIATAMRKLPQIPDFTLAWIV